MTEQELLELDARRYRWLRDKDSESGVSVVDIGLWTAGATCIALTYPDSESVDRAIDDAMQKEDFNDLKEAFKCYECGGRGYNKFVEETNVPCPYCDGLGYHMEEV